MYVLYTESLKACLALLLFSRIILKTVFPLVPLLLELGGGDATQSKGSLVTLATNSSFDKSTEEDK